MHEVHTLSQCRPVVLAPERQHLRAMRGRMGSRRDALLCTAAGCLLLRPSYQLSPAMGTGACTSDNVFVLHGHGSVYV